MKFLSRWRQKRQAKKLQKEMSGLLEAVTAAMKQDPDSPLVRSYLNAIEGVYGAMRGKVREAGNRPQPTRGSE